MESVEEKGETKSKGVKGWRIRLEMERDDAPR